jgi:isopenicillin-N epimerase
VNAVLNSIHWREGDVIILNDQTYNACRLAVEHQAKRFGCIIRTISIPLPASSDEELTEIFAKQLEALSVEFAHKGKQFAKFALLDHISSPTALVFPLDKLVPLFRNYTELVMVDGAHAPGIISPLNVASYGCDYYTGNLHKWVFAPKGCAFLYVRRELQEDQQPLVISHLTRSADWQDRFWMVGTNDQSRLLAVPKALSFFLDKHDDTGLGGYDAVFEYNHNLCLAATDMLCKMWGTKPLLPNEHMSAAYMRSIETPLDYRYFLTAVREGHCNLETLSDGEGINLAMTDGSINERVATEIFKMSGIQGQIVFWPTTVEVTDEATGEKKKATIGRIYSRISCQVYNCLEDYRKLGEAVLELARVSDAEHKPRAW